MIERPAPARASVAQAGAEQAEAAVVAPAPMESAAPEAERAAHLLSAVGPDPALAPPAPPKFAKDPSAPFASAAPRAAPRRAPRAPTGSPTGIEGKRYRAVFACCREAKDTPTM
jgi:hypothetical protein